jgi:hypothetical protein
MTTIGPGITIGRGIKIGGSVPPGPTNRRSLEWFDNNAVGPAFWTIPNNIAFTQNQAFTIETWFKPTSYTGGYIWSMLQSNFLNVAYRNSGKFEIDTSYLGSTPSGYTTVGRTYPINTWYHIAMSWTGTTGKLFINGVQESTFTAAGATVSAGNLFYIGQFQNQIYTQPTPQGALSNFRIVKGTALYTTTFTPPTSPLALVTNTVFLWNITAEDYFKDSSINNFQIGGNGTARVITDQPP